MVMRSDVRCANIDLTDWREVKTNIRTDRGANCTRLTICTVQGSPPQPPSSYQGTIIPGGPLPAQCRGFTIILRHITLGRIPLDEWSAKHRDLYVITHNTHKRQTLMPPRGIRTSNPSEGVAAIRAATEIGRLQVIPIDKLKTDKQMKGTVRRRYQNCQTKKWLRSRQKEHCKESTRCHFLYSLFLF